MLFGQGGGDVQIDDGVAAHHQGGFVEEAGEILDAAHAASRALRLGHDFAVLAHAFVRIADLDAPARAIAKVVLDLPVVVGHVDHDLPDVVPRQVFDQVFEHGLAKDGDHRLGHALGERTDAGSLPRSEDHGFGHVAG